MKYGKRLRNEVERSFPEWRGEFISYKQLKKQLNLIDPVSRPRKRPRISIGEIFDTGYGRNDVNSMTVNVGFTRLLDEEMQKVNTFYIDKEEDYIIRLKELQDMEANLSCRKEMLNLQKDILDFHAEMVLLLHYSVLNSTGFVKIVKKHNKRAGASIHVSFMPRALEQPIFSTGLLYKLMKECEAMLHRLFLDQP
ncbi:SPX domain-containing protein 2-like [Mangifera indica]|uniref:SPX domain-containing protein 2-like n=1 Tax=Mangifera indica TaxID=29780 RepID=UPI001CF997A1|nr:SPX domain-containing protein 2-like [Mangifera indica]